MTKAYVSLPKKSFIRISSLNRLFLTIANVTVPFGAEFPKDTTKVFQLSGNEPSSKHARVSSSSERPATDNCTIIPSKSFKCSTIDWPSLSFKFIRFHIGCRTCFPSYSKECVDLSLWQQIVKTDVHPLANGTKNFLLQHYYKKLKK